MAAAEPSHPVRLAWFPVESLGSPEIAGVINASLARLKVAGSTESFKAAVSMEIAQLTIECVQPTAGCYAAVGRSVKADRLLWVGMDPAGPTGKAIRITLALFDVQGGTFDRRPERTFASVAEARQSLAAFIENALAGGETLSAPRPAVAVRTPAP